MLDRKPEARANHTGARDCKSLPTNSDP